MRKTVVLKVVSSIAVAGQVIRPGGLVEVTESEAKNLLHRGKCVVATEADQVGDVDAESNTDDGDLNPEVAAVNEDAARRAEEAAAVAAEAAAASDAADSDAGTDAAEEVKRADGADSDAEAIKAELSALLDDSVDDIVPLLDGLDDASLTMLRDLEVGGKTRKTLIAAIDAEVAARTPNNT